MNERHIYKSATTSQHAVRDVLSALFTQELLVRSEELFLVQPWISNIAIIDNRNGSFDTLNPEWGKKRFKSQLEDALLDAGGSDRCNLHVIENLHTKGILFGHAALKGSMNLTENGVRFLDEYVSVTFDPHAIAEARVHFDSYLKT
jgi:hypothetical protein